MFRTACIKGKDTIREYTVSKNRFIFTKIDRDNSILRLEIVESESENIVVGTLNNVPLYKGMIKYYLMVFLQEMKCDGADNNAAQMVADKFDNLDLNFENTEYISFM